MGMRSASLWFALIVLEYPLRETLAALREPLAPLDEHRAQDLLRLVVIGVGVQSVGFEWCDARAIRPRDRFKSACARPQLSPTHLHRRTRARGLEHVNGRRIGLARRTTTSPRLLGGLARLGIDIGFQGEQEGGNDSQSEHNHSHRIDRERVAHPQPITAVAFALAIPRGVKRGEDHDDPRDEQLQAIEELGQPLVLVGHVPSNVVPAAGHAF
eukprot:scaffold104486_cov69-Phaeocystis_antarctica.AAC.3